jgi:hypothetical protein
MFFSGSIQPSALDREAQLVSTGANTLQGDRAYTFGKSVLVQTTSLILTTLTAAIARCQRREMRCHIRAYLG